ncbi:MAG: IS1634 family transposase [Candidatus Aminicenantes bacterium]|nr:IS1634 family transposase [Candidatus Aminicenantes bacterium]
MDLERIIQSCLPRSSLALNHGKTLAVLVQNLIVSPAPLYRIAEWANPFEASALGLNESEKDVLNDDRVARSLDALASEHSRSLFFRLALRMIKQFELETERIHFDTTTVTFHGQYKTSLKEPKITHGHNKDHRPDLRQLVFGLNVTSDGAVPLSHQIYSGNRTDDTVHRSNIDNLRQLLGREDFVYVADSKLCTVNNLHHIACYGGKFVTVLPRTRQEDKIFREKLRQIKVRWHHILTIPNKRCKDSPPDVFYTSSEGPSQTKEGYRIVWIKSSQKALLDKEIRLQSIEKAEIDLVALAGKLNKRNLKNGRAINKAYKTILQRYNCQPFIDVKIRQKTQVVIRHLKRGRPSDKDPVEKISYPVFTLEFMRNKEGIRRESRPDGVFPLLTNLTTAWKKEVLLIYKYQPYLEKRFSQIKTEHEIAPVYLKKPKRVAGLIHAHFIAIAVSSLIERQVRKSMVKEKIAELPLFPEGRTTKMPTAMRILEAFSDLCWYEFDGTKEQAVFPIKLSALQKQLLRLLDLPENFFN